MCFSERPRIELNSSEDVFELLVVEEEEERIEIQAQLRFLNIFFQHNIQDGFLQGPIQPVESAIEEPEDEELPLNFKILPSGLWNAPTSYVNMLNQAGQFDEINSQYFVDDSLVTEPSYRQQEL